MHRVLKISTENAFCLHSKERVPYHIIIEVVYDQDQNIDDGDEKLADTSMVENEVPLTDRGAGQKKIEDLVHKVGD